ncbi:MAG: hypothetical protein KBF37_12000 [Saprospiraceae bacterium]|jgi:hypothetical protein|nr:hypothetical protein [Saprospiraceae bacterium]MBP9211031.1 hypothetical protein [Saprospiraceae bacterium]MBV6473120.1 hypothetical protein [Saprospiraceae bacterium]
MTKKKLIFNISLITAFYATVILLGLLLKTIDIRMQTSHYLLFKDLIPVMLAVPIAYLGFCFQRRSSFTNALRQLWSNMIHAVSLATIYTEKPTRSEEEYYKCLLALSKVIDEVRGVYTNIGESHKHLGSYPFESLKSIYDIVLKLPPAARNEDAWSAAAQDIRNNWKVIRKTFLSEFDRSAPTIYDALEPPPPGRSTAE